MAFFVWLQVEVEKEEGRKDEPGRGVKEEENLCGGV